MNLEDLKQGWTELQEQTRKQKIVTAELVRSAINDRVEHLGRGFRLAAIMLTAGFICLITGLIPMIELIINDFGAGGGLSDDAGRSALAGGGLLIAGYMIAGLAVATLYRAHGDILRSGDLRCMSRALQRYSRMSHRIKPATIAAEAVIMWVALYIIAGADMASGAAMTAVPAAIAIYAVKSRRDARDIAEIERRIADLRQLENE